jgi:tetratricopeptide (TPR) repeat protein
MSVIRHIALLFAFVAAAGAEEDADTQAAHRHFVNASLLYESGRYNEAIAEFEIAKSLKPVPAFDFNIGRCYERIERWQEAADAFERYLAASPDVPDAEELRARVATLRSRAPKPKPQPPSLPVMVKPLRPYRVPAAALAGVAVALAAAGGGLVGSVVPEYHDKQSECALRQCTHADWAPMAARADAGYALLAVAGAVAVVDIALWAMDARRGRPRHASIVEVHF